MIDFTEILHMQNRIIYAQNLPAAYRELASEFLEQPAMRDGIDHAS